MQDENMHKKKDLHNVREVEERYTDPKKKNKHHRHSPVFIE